MDDLSRVLPAACRGQMYALNMQYSPQGALSNVPANSVLVAFSPSNSTAAPSPGDFKVQLAGTQQAGEVLSIIPYQRPQSYLVQVRTRYSRLGVCAHLLTCLHYDAGILSSQGGFLLPSTLAVTALSSPADGPASYLLERHCC